MGTTTTAAPRASASKTPTPNRRDVNARDAVFLHFRSRDARAIDQGDFVDRRPNDRPRHIGKVAAAVVNDVGDQALKHWIAQAALAKDSAERKAAPEIAREIASLMGIDVDLSEQDAA